MDRNPNDRRAPYPLLFPKTFSFPLIRTGGLPREFRGEQNLRALTHFLYDLDFELYCPLWR